MSLDETLVRMRLFAVALDRFDDALRGSLAALDACHADAQVEWRDAFSREYEMAWQPLSEGLRRWTAHEAPAYHDFMRLKLYSLQSYLGEDR